MHDGRVRRTAAAIAGSVIIIALLLGPATAAPAPRRATALEHLDKLAAVGKNLLARIRPDARDVLSVGGRNLLNVGDQVDRIKNAKKAGSGVSGKQQGPKALLQGQGNDPFASEDLLSRFSGMTQSETTAAWCGDNAAIGFNDSGSFMASLFLGASPSGSLSFDGWSRSRDRGASYTDMGALTADPLPTEIMFRDLLGDPLLGCTSSSTFYYGSLAIDSGFDFAFMNSGISVSQSTNGAASFSGAVMAVSKDGFTHFLDKPWMAVGPGPTSDSDDDVVHVTYTDFDGTGFEDANAACPNEGRTAIEYVRSSDSGQTWSDPIVLEEVCGDFSFLQGSQVEAGVGDDVYVAWEHFTTPESDRDIRISKSTDGGASFTGPEIIGPVTPIGDSFVVQGNFRAFIDLQGLAVDRSTGSRRGTVYLSWHDGRNRSKVDPFAFCGGEPAYCFGDILVTHSASGSGSWSDPVRVNDDDIRLGIDQVMPALDVDASGNAWIAFYDRRRDSRNLLLDTYLAKSIDGGRSWSNNRLTSTNFAPITGWQDFVVNPLYMGDYIAVASDQSGKNPGVIVAWGDNSLGDANVRQARK